jgi:hypothetical protein
VVETAGATAKAVGTAEAGTVVVMVDEEMVEAMVEVVEVVGSEEARTAGMIVARRGWRLGLQAGCGGDGGGGKGGGEGGGGDGGGDGGGGEGGGEGGGGDGGGLGGGGEGGGEGGGGEGDGLGGGGEGGGEGEVAGGVEATAEAVKEEVRVE